MLSALIRSDIISENLLLQVLCLSAELDGVLCVPLAHPCLPAWVCQRFLVLLVSFVGLLLFLVLVLCFVIDFFGSCV